MFYEEQERLIIEQFLETGYVIFALESMQQIERVREKIFSLTEPNGVDHAQESIREYLDYFHRVRPGIDLNAFRLSLIEGMAADPAVRADVYWTASKHLHWLVGNELAMQRVCNLSIQQPDDQSAILPLHTDIWSGNSPYEVVLWLPLVDCFRTKSMFLLPREKSRQVCSGAGTFRDFSTEQLYRRVEKDLIWLDVPFGHGVLFWHGLLHGNRVNCENETRWTINVRFKSLLSPYGTKEIGESFLPITPRPLTRIGYEYREPAL